MKNFLLPSSASSSGQAWTPNELLERDSERLSPIFRWWYKMTVLPEPPATASFVKREEARRMRLLSTVLFYFLPILCLAIPSCIFIPNKSVIYIAIGLALMCVLALVVNRAGRVWLGAITLIAGLELALMIIIMTTYPLDETGLQLYDLLCLVELFAVSLLPPRGVFVIAFFNCVFITLDAFYQKRTPNFEVLMHSQFFPILSRPLAIQIIIAGVAYLWVASATKAIKRADKAEMVVKLEHALVEQKQLLENGVKQILQTHVEVANGNLNARAPLTQESMLWQIARALNTLLVRLQRAVLAEKELHRVEQAVTQSVHSIQQAEQMQQAPSLSMTQTALDPLIAALQGKTIKVTQSTFQQRNAHNQATGPHRNSSSGFDSGPAPIIPNGPRSTRLI